MPSITVTDNAFFSGVRFKISCSAPQSGVNYMKKRLFRFNLQQLVAEGKELVETRKGEPTRPWREIREKLGW
jgi:hypothetical protein